MASSFSEGCASSSVWRDCFQVSNARKGADPIAGKGARLDAGPHGRLAERVVPQCPVGQSDDRGEVSRPSGSDPSGGPARPR